MANLHYDYSALVIYLVILFSMVTRKIVRGNTFVFFLQLLFLSFITTIADIISETPAVSNSLREAADYVYFMGAVLIPLFYAIYIYASIGLIQYFKGKISIWLKLIIPFIVYAIITLSNLFTDCVFSINESGEYIRGPLQPIIVIVSFIYIFAGISIIIKWYKIIPKEKFFALMTFFPIMSIGMIIQQIHKGFELNMFGLAISELILAFTVQRDGENFDKVTGTKSYTSALDDFQKLFLTKQAACVVYIKVKNQKSLGLFLGTTLYNKFLKLLSHQIYESVKEYKKYVELYYIQDEIFSLKITSLDIETVRVISDTINENLKNSIKINDLYVSIETAICIVRIPDDINNLESLMNFRLNFHKKLPEKKTVLELSDFLNSKEFKIKNELDEIISRALKDNHLQMYYQPIYSVEKKKFVSAEALIRLIDPIYGFIRPDIFIPHAETTGAIHQIGDFVIDSVCKFISTTDFEKLGLEYIELNLSVNQCIEANFVEKIESFAGKYSINPGKINLEITESVADFDPEVMDKNIKTLHAEGFKFSLDDFGTGYSNIKRVTSLPLEIVKLDKSFVDEMNNPQMWSVIINTIKMFKEMKKIVLVEGVETKETLEAFESLGCDYIQGYYFSKPVPEREFIEFLKARNNSSASS